MAWAVVVALQFVGTVMALYLPSLNADIIDNGVVTGDTGYIVHIGAVMLGDEMIDEASRKMALVISAKGRAAGLVRTSVFEKPTD